MPFLSIESTHCNPFNILAFLAFFFLPSRDPEIFVEIARWPRFSYKISRALVSHWHSPNLVLPTRLHSNTCSFFLLSFSLVMESSTPSYMTHPWDRRSPENPRCTPNLLSWNSQIKMPILDDSVYTGCWWRLLHWRRYCHPKVTNSSIAMQDTKDQIIKLLFFFFPVIL